MFHLVFVSSNSILWWRDMIVTINMITHETEIYIGNTLQPRDLPTHGKESIIIPHNHIFQNILPTYKLTPPPSPQSPDYSSNRDSQSPTNSQTPHTLPPS